MTLRIGGIATEACERIWRGGIDANAQPAIVRGYGEDHWIRYDTGRVVRGTGIADACEAILQDTDVAYVHVRSKFNCFQCRVDRG